MDDEVGRRVVEETRSVLGRCQVVVRAPCDERVVTGRAKAFDDVRAEEAAAAGDEHLHACSLVVASVGSFVHGR
jgi:hypothetical protein